MTVDIPHFLICNGLLMEDRRLFFWVEEDLFKKSVIVYEM
jgi:hypothetical protein